MEVKYIEELFDEEKRSLIPEFDYNSETPFFKLMRLQGKLELEYDEYDGPKIIDEKYKELCKKSLILAKEKDVDILLTPEYSIPISLIDEIVNQNNTDIIPPLKKIWCLCCEAMSLDEFENKIEEWRQKDIVIYNADYLNIKKSNFVDILIYIFKLTNGHLCLITQFKTHPMSDTSLKCEQAGLSTGDTIYMFGKDKANQLCTIICADALNNSINTHSLFKNGNENIILLHPQMNMSPRNNIFFNLRHTVYSNELGDNLIYISSNCAFGTGLKGRNGEEGEEGEIKCPWSCVYIKNRDNTYYKKNKNFRISNGSKGINYGYMDKMKLDVWYSIKEENIQIFEVVKPRKAYVSTNNPKINLRAILLYLPNKERKEWEEIEKYDRYENFKDSIEIDEEEYRYPYTISKEEMDVFFGICDGKFEKGQLIIDENEISKILSLHIDDECENERKNSRIQFFQLIMKLRNRELPPQYGTMVHNHEFTLIDNIFNLRDRNSDEKIMVMFVKNNSELKQIEGNIKEALNKRVLKEIENNNIEEAIKLKSSVRPAYCIFYIDDRTGKAKIIPEYNNKISDPDRVTNPVSFREG